MAFCRRRTARFSQANGLRIRAAARSARALVWLFSFVTFMALLVPAHGQNSESLILLDQRARDGDPDSQFDMAQLYRTGTFVEQNFNYARRWYRIAANAGHAMSQYSLGLMAAYGQGGPKDEAEAENWFLEAAKNGSVNAKFNLGQLYRTGFKGQPPDIQKSVFFFDQAARQKHAIAQVNLAAHYAKLHGLHNMEAATFWYQVAINNGYHEASFVVGYLKEKLPKESIIKILKLVETCTQNYFQNCYPITLQ